jgi:gas vesicle protein
MFTSDQAEAHAEAARDFIMAELVTKTDLVATKQELQTEFRSVSAELRNSIAELRTELRHSIAEVRNDMNTQALRMTVRLGAMLVVAIGALATILKLT